MKTTVSVYDFMRAFEDAGRKDQFSRAGLRALFDDIEQLEQETGIENELDVIALCCDWSEYKTAKEAAEDMSGFTPDDDNAETEALDYLRDNTQVIEFDGGILVAAF